MMLLVDIGNTRIKWATLTGDDLSAQSAAAYADWTHEDLSQLMLRQLPKPEGVIVANVGGARIGELLSHAVRSSWGIETRFVHSTAHVGEVRNAYPEPSHLGVDRWMAMIGVHAMQAAPACIVSIGTAMTIDALDGSGRHLGGVIVPGPELMVSSLLRNTSEIGPRALQGNVGLDVFADNTLGAIRQGSVNALAALVERALQSMHERISATPTLFLTGGASGLVESLLLSPYRRIDDLVLRGLAVIAGTR